MPIRPQNPSSGAQNSSSGFGRRPTDWRGQPAGERLPPLEALRQAAADIIRKWDGAPADVQASYFIQIRQIQDQISGMHHRSLSTCLKTSALSWVDVWSPP